MKYMIGVNKFFGLKKGGLAKHKSHMMGCQQVCTA